MKREKIAAFVISTMITLSVLTACGGSQDKNTAVENDKSQEVHLAVVIGSHDNAPRPNLGLIENDIYRACYTYGSVTLVCDDGDPYTTVVDIPEQEKGLSSSKYKQIANDQTKQIMETASKMQAKTPEIDTLKAIQLGARSLASVETKREGIEIAREMVICDSCLSTTGVLSFLERNLNGLFSESIVDQLKELDEIPTLDNVSVTVYTCGDTDGKKQKILTESNRKALKDVWRTILEAGNAEVNMKDDLPLSSIYEESTLPAVRTVSVVQDSIAIKDIEAVDSAFLDGGIISFDEKSIAFCMGTAEFIDKEAAKEALGYIAGYINDHPDFQLLICGTTACSGGEEYCMTLSKERADAVCQLMEQEFGISKECLNAVGVGYSFDEFYIYDQMPDGTLDEEIAPINRSVKLIPLSSETANKILEMV